MAGKIETEIGALTLDPGSRRLARYADEQQKQIDGVTKDLIDLKAKVAVCCDGAPISDLADLRARLDRLVARMDPSPAAPTEPHSP